MATYNLPSEWSLELCKVKEAWEITPPNPNGASFGEGIIIGHADTGWTNHPELLQGSNYLTSYPVSRNFFLPSTIPSGTAAHFLSGEDLMSHDEGPIRAFDGHGTSTASVLASGEGHPNNPPPAPPPPPFPSYTVPTTAFVTGVAPKAQVLPVRVSSDVELGNEETDIVETVGRIWDTYYSVNTYNKLAQAIEYLRKYSISGPLVPEMGVISISMAGSSFSRILFGALINARKAGVIVCAATGHLISWLPDSILLAGILYPASDPSTIAVAGCDNLSVPSPAGFYSSKVDIVAPGFGVRVADTSGNEWVSGPRPSRNFVMNTNGQGTSHSAPFVAGACALWQAFHGRSNLISRYTAPLLFDAFKHCLQSSARVPSGWNTSLHGAGVINVEDLLNCSLPTLAVIETAASSAGWTAAIRNAPIEDIE
tara:strand:- start:4810 stop:6084 length:1275 start_codon:yes stop_codon:yes gene_type:complete